MPRTFQNPILPNGADPWVVFKNGFYYYTHTTGTNITIWSSRTLSGIGAGEAAIVWTPPEGTPYSRNLWAPELHNLRDRWYVYFAADNGHNETHRMYVLESAGSDPFGPYRLVGPIADRTNRWAIDGTVLETADGRLYMIWSGWEGDVNVRQNLYIAPMSSPTQICGERVELSRPTLDWECIGKPNVNEGPVALIRGERIYLVYSASGSWTDDYCLGLLTARLGADLLDPASWRKHPEPVFAKTDAVFGPGHNSFVRSPDGTEDWIVYHAAKSQGSGWNRDVRIQRFDWGPDGLPVFGEPEPAGKPLAVPSGE